MEPKPCLTRWCLMLQSFLFTIWGRNEKHHAKSNYFSQQEWGYHPDEEKTHCPSWGWNMSPLVSLVPDSETLAWQQPTPRPVSRPKQEGQETCRAKRMLVTTWSGAERWSQGTSPCAGRDTWDKVRKGRKKHRRGDWKQAASIPRHKVRNRKKE